MSISFFKEKLFHFPIVREIYKNRSCKNKTLISESESRFFLDTAEVILLDKKINSRVALVVDRPSPFDGYIYRDANFPKFQRFLENNKIEYEYFDIHSSLWLDNIRDYDVVIFRPDCNPHSLDEARKKIWILNQLGIKTFPSYKDILLYEDKIMSHFFFKINNIPEIKTVVSYSESECELTQKLVGCPCVSKFPVGASSSGVSLIKTSNAFQKFYRKAFSYKGIKTYYHYLRQKGYIYCQEFIDDANYDLRVIVVGKSLFGYYRLPNKGDFRASGSGNYLKKDIPVKALDLAWNIRSKYGSPLLAVDFLFSESKKQYSVIETSIFIGVETDCQLVVDDIPGRYVRVDKGQYKFEKGRFWIQELALKEFFETKI